MKRGKLETPWEYLKLVITAWLMMRATKLLSHDCPEDIRLGEAFVKWCAAKETRL